MINIDPEFAALIPPISKEEKEMLEASLLKEGCRDRLTVWNGILLDGHNRLSICEANGITYNVRDIALPDRDAARLWIVENQLGRRNLCAYDRGVLELTKKDILAAQAKERMLATLKQNSTAVPTLAPRLEQGKTRDMIAKLAGVSHGTLAKIEAIQLKAQPEQIERLRTGETSISKAFDELQGKIHIADDSYEWYTPAKYVEAARAVMGSIDLDPASCETANQTIKAKTFYTKKDNGLDLEWFGNVFLNPPYNMPWIERFVSKVVKEYKSGRVNQAIVLTNNATDTAWFHSLLKCGPVCFTLGRIHFIGENATEGMATRQGQAFCYMGDNINGFHERFEVFGAVMVLHVNS